MARVLAGEDIEVWVADELLVQLGDVNCSPVIENGVEALQDTLLGQVHFIDEEPVALLDC